MKQALKLYKGNIKYIKNSFKYDINNGIIEETNNLKVLDIDKDTGEVIKTDKIVVFLDQKLEKYKETLGYYSIVTSEIEDNDKEIINRYHGLSRIEDSFRIIKSDLEGISLTSSILLNNSFSFLT